MRRSIKIFSCCWMYLFLTFGAVLADTSCPVSKFLLIGSCNNPLSVQLRVLPDNYQAPSGHLLTVAGTYSSGDRFGIEGLVIKSGEIVSRRYQNWDGVLIIDGNGMPSVYNAKAVLLGDLTFDLKDKKSRDGFIERIKDDGSTILQSHLLISDGVLDLEDISNAPKFKRRLFVTFEDGSFGIWESQTLETLYDAAVKLQRDLDPVMALNLDMGAYDYCKLGPIDLQFDCGNLLISEDKLTNLLEFSNL